MNGKETLRATLEKNGGKLFENVVVDELPEISNTDPHHDHVDAVRYSYEHRD